MMRLGQPASLVEFNNMKFVITHMPDLICTRRYIQDLQQYDTRRLVKVCDISYSVEMFNTVGIAVEELLFPNGSFPPSEIIERWLTIVKQHFQTFPTNALAVHCESGLGRSAVLVAIALMECSMRPQETIDYIQERRRGAFNTNQVEEILKYKSKNRLLEKTKLFIGFRRSLSPDSITSTSS